MSSAADFQLQDVAPGKNDDTAIRFRIGMTWSFCSMSLVTMGFLVGLP